MPGINIKGWIFAALCLGLLASGCGEDEVEAASDVAQSCGGQPCPAGTAPRQLSQISVGTDISGGIDPETYIPDGAYKRFGEGSCEYACEVINPCPCPSDVQCTFPVITETCFTCGTLNSAGEVQQGSCGGS